MVMVPWPSPSPLGRAEEALASTVRASSFKRPQTIMPRVIHPRLRFIEPQLASSVDQPPEGKHWIHEVKHDGYRSQIVIENGKSAGLHPQRTMTGVTAIPGIVRAASDLRCRSAIIDGEAIVQDGNGASDFDALPAAIQSRSNSIILCAFDLLHLNGVDLRQQILLDRRAELSHLLGGDPTQPHSV